MRIHARYPPRLALLTVTVVVASVVLTGPALAVAPATAWSSSTRSTTTRRH